MIFFGGIKQPLRKTLGDIAKNIDKEEKIQILCSGKFTIENILCNLGFRNVYGNDISLLTSAIGKYLVGENIDFSFKQDSEFIALEEKLPCKMQNSEKTQYRHLRKQVYMRTIEKSYYRNKEEFIKRYGELQGKLKGFYTTDLVNFLDKEEGIKICSIPIEKGDYENIYKVFDNNLEFEKHPYTEIDKESYLDINQQFLENHRSIVFCDRELREECNKYKSASYKIGNQRWHCYTSLEARSKIFMIENKMPNKFFRFKLFDEDCITQDARVEICRVNASVYNFFRNRFQSKKLIILGDAHLYYVVLINGKYVGAFAYKDYSRGTLTLLSDFTFFNKWKISKLIPMLARSKEVMEEVFLNLYRRPLDVGSTIYTRVVTPAPISMKYRGIWDLFRRGEEDGEKFLIYSTKIGEKTIQEEFQEWLKNHYNTNK